MCEPDGTFYYARTLTEEVDAPTLQIDAYDRAIAVYLDGECLYSDGGHGRGHRRSGARGAGLDAQRARARVAARRLSGQGTDHRPKRRGGGDGSALHRVSLRGAARSCGYAYESGLIAESFAAAIPADAAAAPRARCLLAAFAVGAWRGQVELAGALRGAVPAFVDGGRCWASTTSFFSVYYPATRDNTAYLCRCFAVSALLMFLASRAKRLRALPWALAGLERGLQPR